MRKDLTAKMLIEYPDVFADVGNVCLFQGEQVIQPESLELLPQELYYREEDGELREHRMDVRMRVKENGVELAVLHLENQSGISNVMPLRDMGYTYSGYQGQLRRLKEKNREQKQHFLIEEIGRDQKLCPVISLILYYGTETWNAPTCLKEMLDIPDKGDQRWDSLIKDHSIHLIDLSRQSDEQVSQYKSDLWYIVQCLKCGKDRDRYKRFLEEDTRREMKHPEAVIDMITAFAGKTEARQMAAKAIQRQKKKGGSCTMYTILDYLEEIGLEKGLDKGRNEIYYKMFQNDKTPEDISEFTGESLEYLYEIQERYLTTVVQEENRKRKG